MGCRRRIVRAMAAKLREVMGHASAADDQDALRPQRRQRSPYHQVMLRPEMRLNRKLQDGNVRLRVHQKQRHPGAVIEAAAVIGSAVQSRGVQQIRDLCRNPWRPRGRILQFIERARKSKEVVNGVVPLNRAHRGHSSLPMRGDHENGFRTLQPCPQPLQESARRRVGQRQGWRAVREEKAGQDFRYHDT